MIKFIKRDVTNNILVFFLFLCFWGIMAIGFGFNCLLIDVGDSWSTDTVNRSNDVFKNLSYSYFAGYVVYFLTVLVPYYKKKKLVQPIIYYLSDNLLSDTLISFLSIYYGNMDDLNILKREKIEKLITEEIKTSALFKSIYIKKDSCPNLELVDVVLPKIKTERDLFIDRMSINMAYLSKGQNEILNDISKNKLEKQICVGFKDESQLIGITPVLVMFQKEKHGVLANAIEPFADYVILINELLLLSENSSSAKLK